MQIDEIYHVFLHYKTENLPLDSLSASDSLLYVDDPARRKRVVDRRADPDPAETAEWLEALDSVFRTEGIERGHYLIERLIDQARRSGAHLPY